MDHIPSHAGGGVGGWGVMGIFQTSDIARTWYKTQQQVLSVSRLAGDFSWPVWEMQMDV